MLRLKPYGRPCVRVVFGVCQTAQVVRNVAIRPVEACLLEFLYYYSSLYLERAFAEVEGEHAVAFDMECRGYVLSRQSVVEIGEVGACPGVALSSGIL